MNTIAPKSNSKLPAPVPLLDRACFGSGPVPSIEAGQLLPQRIEAISLLADQISLLMPKLRCAKGSEIHSTYPAHSNHGDANPQISEEYFWVDQLMLPGETQ